MKTTYVTFTREMARAYREGRKKMTRRVIVPQPASVHFSPMACTGSDYLDQDGRLVRCPYGRSGDRLIFGTTWAVSDEFDHLKPTELPMHVTIDGLIQPITIWSYFRSDNKPEGFGKLRPARFLPSKLRYRMPCETLKIVRAEQVQSITEEDAVREGIVSTAVLTPDGGDYTGLLASDQFPDLWDSINAKRGYSWGSNPWVWVLGW